MNFFIIINLDNFFFFVWQFLFYFYFYFSWALSINRQHLSKFVQDFFFYSSFCFIFPFSMLYPLHLSNQKYLNSWFFLLSLLSRNKQTYKVTQQTVHSLGDVSTYAWASSIRRCQRHLWSATSEILNQIQVRFQIL